MPRMDKAAITRPIVSAGRGTRIYRSLFSCVPKKWKNRAMMR